jgi:hypothetical protein
MNDMTVCAIVINYFGAHLTERCVRSLAGESLTTLWLIDNSATEDERNAILSLASDMRSLGVTFEVNTLFNDSNLGFSAAINRAIAADRSATGGHGYYLLLNNDAVVKPGLVKHLIEATAKDSRIALVAPRIIWNGKPVSRFWYHRYLGLITQAPLPGSFPYLAGCCLLVDSALIEGGKLLDEDFFMYGEDVELSARAMRVGMHLGYAGNGLVIHTSTGSSRKGAKFYEYHVVRGHILLADKLASTGIERAILRGCRMLSLAFRAMTRCIRYGNSVPLHALLEARRES